MKIKFHKKIVIVLSCILSGYALAQQGGWDLKQCIDYAIKHNISIKQNLITTEINKNNTLQSKANILPTLNFGVAHTYNFGQTIDRYTNTFANTQVLSENLFLSSNLVVWSGLSQYNTIKANEYNYLSSIENVKQLQYDLSLNVANAYMQVLFTDEQLKIAQNQFNISEEQLERTSKMVAAGTSPKTTEYDVKSQLANDNVNKINAENNYMLAVLNLKQLLNIDSMNYFFVVKPTIDVNDNLLLSKEVNQIYDLALKNQAQIKSAEYKIKSAEKSLLANKGKVSPTISINGSIGTGYSGLAKDIEGVKINGFQMSGFTNKGDTVFSPLTSFITKPKSFYDQYKDNINKSIGITLSLPIYNGLQTYTAIKNAKLNALNAKFGLDLAKQNLYKNIAQAHANALAALNKYKANKLSVAAAAQSFEFAQQKFNIGAISSFDYNQAKNRLFAAESNLLQSKYDYVFKLKVLDYYEGKPLEL
ncbi:MAG: TolC family protein [Bacteroidetes bacterium]|nr:TolC family protein [Bacteroidota bacterium]